VPILRSTRTYSSEAAKAYVARHLHAHDPKRVYRLAKDGDTPEPKSEQTRRKTRYT
jgi:hypothetical protein